MIGVAVIHADDLQSLAAGTRLGLAVTVRRHQVAHPRLRRAFLVGGAGHRGDQPGPRPEQPCEAALWEPDQFDRLRVRPGLTGMWQICGRSSARDAKDRLDLYYVDNWSIWRDTTIMLKTLPVVISSKGAY